MNNSLKNPSFAGIEPSGVKLTEPQTMASTWIGEEQTFF